MDIKQEVMDIIASLTLFELGKIDEIDRLQDLGFDSLKMVELIIALEDTFAVTFDDSELDPNNFVKVNDIIELVQNLLEMET